jgi:hypothetical protein
MKRGRVFVLTLRSLRFDDRDTIRTLRLLLKSLLRQHRFRCEVIEEVGE